MSLRIVVEVDKPTGQAIGVKEALAMYLERFGDSRVVEVTEIPQKQMRLEEVGLYGGEQPKKRSNV